MKRTLCLMLAMIMLLTGLAGCAGSPTETSSSEVPSSSDASTSDEPSASSTASSDGEPIRILYAAKNLADPFHSWLSNMTVQTLEENYDNVEVNVIDLRADPANTQNAVDQAIVDEYDGLILDKPSSAQNTDDMVAELDKNGIKVVLVNTNYANQDDGFSSTSGATNEELGFAVGSIAAEKLPENAKILVLLSTPSNAGSDDRWKGYQRALESRDDIEILEVKNNEDWAKEKAMRVMDDWLQVYDEIDAVLAMNDGMALGCIEACKADGRDLSQMQFYGIDGLGDACLSIQAGELTASVLQDANDMGENAARMIYDMITKNAPREEYLITPIKIDESNVEEIIAIHKETGALD